MILPTKHVRPEASLLGVGAVILEEIGHPQTISRLWDKVRVTPEVRSFDRFVVALGFLYAIGVVDYREGFIQRSQP